MDILVHIMAISILENYNEYAKYSLKVPIDKELKELEKKEKEE